MTHDDSDSEAESELDISSEAPQQSGQSRENSRAQPKFLGVVFTCCNIYTRCYRDRGGGNFYLGKCPRCGKQIRFVEGNNGRSERFFRTR